MIRIRQPQDINWVNLYRIACQDEKLEIDTALLAAVDAGRQQFDELIERGVPCYGVTTGLGQLADLPLDAAARAGIANNMLYARAAAIGAPFSRSVARATLVIRLVNFLTARSAVGSDLCRFIVDRLNDGFTPWIPSLGHGMAGDAIAHCHAFQTLIGEGFVYGVEGQRMAAADALRARGIEPCRLDGRDGLALVGGFCASPALGMEAFYLLDRLLKLGHLVAAVSIEGLAAPRDIVDPLIGQVQQEPGIARTIEILRRHLNHSRIEAHKLQAPVSYRIIVQVHGAMHEALARLREKIEFSLTDCSDNPLLDGERLLSVGCFHNQHLVNQVEHTALALAHLGSLSERRLHRLLDPDCTGLNAQLAARPGLDAGLVVTQKACIDLAARLRVLAQPVSLHTAESSGGQEDYMALCIPALARLFDMAELTRAILAYELLAAITAVRLRAQTPGDGVAAVIEHFAPGLAAPDRDRSPGIEVEALLAGFEDEAFLRLLD